MSMHRIQLTELERTGLINHGLAVGSPSQLSDVFRHGVKWALDNVKAVPQWIPVSERRPGDHQPVDVYGVVVGGNNNGDKSRVSNCFYDEDVNRFWYWNQRCTRRVYFSGFDVTHWMPIPSLPEQNK